jgi:ADP-ribosylglycohydrolase
MGTPEKPINNSKGCGGVMRAAPVGLFAAKAFQAADPPGSEWKATFDLGCRAAAITHGHPSGYLPAGCLATIIYGVISGLNLEEAIHKTLTVLTTAKGYEETLDAVKLALNLWKKKPAKADPETIEKMGGGWVSLLCPVRGRRFCEGNTPGGQSHRRLGQHGVDHRQYSGGHTGKGGYPRLLD